GLVAVLMGTVFAVATNPGQGGDALGAGPPTNASVSPTRPPPDLPIGNTPGREVPLPGVGGHTATVTVTVPGGGTPPTATSGTSFSTNGGSVVVVCDAFGPRPTAAVPNPACYPHQLARGPAAW